jgi:hypothetical protein
VKDFLGRLGGVYGQPNWGAGRRLCAHAGIQDENDQRDAIQKMDSTKPC